VTQREENKIYHPKDRLNKMEFEYGYGEMQVIKNLVFKYLQKKIIFKK
jgi:hypothetical protein